ncbi:MAG: WD40 repeat domain-containing protein [Opitutaceae bacterium]
MNLTKAWAAQLDDYCIDLAWSPDGRVLASASAAGPVTLFDAQGTRRHTLPGHADGTNAVGWMPTQRSEASNQKSGASIPTPGLRSPASGLLASGGQDGCVRFWDTVAGTALREVAPAAGAWVEHLAWRPPAASTVNLTLPDASHLLLAAATGRKLVLLKPDGSIAHTFKEAPKTLSAIAWLPQGGAIAAAWFGGVCLWDAGDFHVRREYAYGSAIHALVWSPDGRWLVAGTQDNAVHLWIPEENQEFHMSGYETKVRELSFSSDSRWLATGGARDACIWDCSGAGPDGREPLALPHSDRVCAVAFQQTHGLLATAAGDGEVKLWIPTGRQPLVATVKLTAPASKFAWSPDDSLLAIGSQQGGVLVLRVDA